MLLKHAEGGELEPGDLNYSTAMCEADEGRGFFRNVRDLGGSLSRTPAPWWGGTRGRGLPSPWY